MKLLSARPAPGGPASVRLQPEEAEDLWHLYNLIAEGDRVQAVTVRKVVSDTGGGGGEARESERVKLRLTLCVTGVEYDAQGGSLRVRGRNETECEAVKFCAFHSLELEVGRPLALEKAEWDAGHAELLRAACDPAASAELVAVMIEDGLANVCLVGGAVTTLAARCEVSMPRKTGAAAQGRDKAARKLFDAVITALLRHVDFSKLTCLLIAGPGFAKEAFLAHLSAEAARRPIPQLLECRSKIVLAPASSAYKHALAEALRAPAVAQRVRDTACAAQSAALDAFFEQLSLDSSRAFYGPGHVRAAHEQYGAVQTLLLSDSLYRSAASAEARRGWVALVEGVRGAGGEAHVFSSAHASGEQLDKLSGVAAILRFPLPELEEQEL